MEIYETTESSELISEGELQPADNDDDDDVFRYYNAAYTNEKNAPQLQDSAVMEKQLEQMELDRKQKGKTPPESQSGEELVEQLDKLEITEPRPGKSRFKALDPDFIPTPNLSKYKLKVCGSLVEDAGRREPIKKKRSFFSKFSFLRRSSSSGSTTTTTTNNADDDESTTTDVAAGDKKADAKKARVNKNQEMTMWGSPVDRLIGDLSQQYALPTIMGLHPDLKSITPNVIIRLFKGIYEEEIESFRLLDCRYPYEYEGGHIRGALNIYTREQTAYLLSGKARDVDGRRNILVFYCEFSSERAPGLCRYLRDEDRKLNKHCHPKLNYPEVYLLAGGYKKFFADYPTWCIPQAYKPMLHPEHAHEMHYFRTKLKGPHVENYNFERTTKSRFYNKLAVQWLK